VQASIWCAVDWLGERVAVRLEYTIRLNNVGEFSLPPSRVEAMYAPEMFGEAPNARVRVEGVK
jgi:hypothetical protein